MKKLLLAAMVLSSINAFADTTTETWTCVSADNNTKIVATTNEFGASAVYNSVELKAANVYWEYTNLVGDAGTRDTYHYELKLLRDDRTLEGTGRAVLFIDEWIDCLGTYTDFVPMTCTVK